MTAGNGIPEPRFGVFLVPYADDYPELVDRVRVAEQRGIDLIGIQDHPYQRRFLDTFALIGNLLAKTERLRFFPDVANLPLRPPAMLAKMAASLDVMSGGRFELGIGAGAFWDAIVAMGGPVRSPKESIGALEEAIAILRASWSGQRSVQFDGRYYSVGGFHPGPVPAHEIGIWIGAYRPRMLELIGRLGDGWVPSLPYAPPEVVPAMQRSIDDAASDAGRDPGAIRRIYNVAGQITDRPTAGLLEGPADHWIETLSRFYLELRMDTFVFGPSGDPAGQIERFADEVVPGAREATAPKSDEA